MSSTLEQIRALVARGEVRVSLHGFEELAADAVRVRDVVAGLRGLSWSRTIRTTRKGAAVSSCNAMERIDRFM